ncbi:MAG: thiamine pyrophosphate-binding protein [Proteobacteria bacterium]|nr:thiamine pyrophosphate-binding protein [Pseudomonadota bacterium]MCP4917668.1 thiamine pyrophosphate-binding protein [Pseudomonadota bacterium]
MPTTSQILARTLYARGVRHAFGMPGGVVLPLLEAFREVGIDFVLVKHEGSAGFMADAYAQVNGTPGVCVATLGPGATNLVSGMAGALLDRAPVVAITGEAERTNVYTHQTLDQTALFKPVSKVSMTLTSGEAWREIPLALRHLEHGRRGPVHLNIPASVFSAGHTSSFDDRFEPLAIDPRLSLGTVAARLGRALRPMMLVGLGDMTPRLAQVVGQVAAARRIPVMSTYKAKGVPDENHEWYAGAFGLSTTVDALQQDLLSTCDLLVTVGLDPVELRPQWLPGWREDLPVIALDRAAPTDLTHPVDTLVVGDPALSLAALIGTEGASEWTPDDLADHWDRMAGLFREEITGMGPASAIAAIQAGLPDEHVVALDVGAHRITASHVWTCSEPNTLLQSNGFSSMGYGLPAAIAAKLARPDRTCVALTGDAGLWMTLGELALVAERGMDLVVVYLADGSLSLIEKKQQALGLPQTGVRFQNPDVMALAQAFGGQGESVSDLDALTASIEAAVARGGLCLIEAVIDPSPYTRQV